MNKKTNTDCSIVFIIAFIVCGLQSIKACKEDSSNEKTTRIFLPSSPNKETKIIRLLGSDDFGGDSNDNRNSNNNRERLQ